MAIDDRERQRQRTLFRRYAETQDPEVKDELVTAHIRLAEHLARRFSNRGVPVDDLVQVASLGLVKAVERFDPERGLEFSTFATPTILGELKRHFRDRGWSVRVPRRIQELHLEINGLVGELTQALGRSPTVTELAERAHVAEEDVLEAMEAGRMYRSASLDARIRSADGDGTTLESLLGVDDEGIVDTENALLVDRLLETLPPREQLMMRLRFYEEMTQTEIADRLDISQMHVSRLLARSLAALRQTILADTD